VVDQGHIAALAERHVATLAAEHEAVAATPVEVEDGLLMLRESSIERATEGTAEERVVARPKLSTHIHHLHGGHWKLSYEVGAVAGAAAANATR
jgi:hypothetical protein